MNAFRSLAFLSLLASASTWAAEPSTFNRDIRPILSEHCFACHGLDEKHRQAELRLDLPDTAFARNESGDAAIVPGDPEASLAWSRIVATDPDEIMPPPDSHKKLEPQEKALIRRWIEQGARYQKHWAFEVPVKPAKPLRDGIDHFVGQALLKEGLNFSPEADRPTLIRRVSMALTGLPPALRDVDVYLEDTTEDAYERMVDRYLRSPHFGEEMARHWLDVARYGDTHGMHLDNERQTWAYRDWVVSAFNRNLPYDQFTIEQLAGDLLPEPSQDQLVATGFNRCNVTTGEGGSIKEEFIFRYAVDRASTTAQAWLGLSAGCAVCHDHKYDPITQKEFYSLYAFFHSNADPAMDGNRLLTAPVIKIKPEGYDGKMKVFADREAAIQKQMDVVSDAITYHDPAEANPPPPVATSEQVWFDDAFPAGAKVQYSGGPHRLVAQPVPAHGKKSIQVAGPGMAQVFYEGGPDLTLPREPRFFLHVYLDPENPPQEIMLQFNTGGWSHRAIWGEDRIHWGRKNSSERFAAGDLPDPGQWTRLEVDAAKLGLGKGARVKGFAFTLFAGTAYFDQMGVIGESDPANDPTFSFIAWRQARKGKNTRGVPQDINAWLTAGPEKKLNRRQLERLRDYYLQNVCHTTRSSFASLLGERTEVRDQRATYNGRVPSTFIFRDLPQPRQSYVMLRGEYDNPGEQVQPGTPAVLPKLQQSGDRANRLDLARWIVAPENPLTARVAVNRFWQQLFGRGLVETSHDFGTQGTMPSHPELLDWLAVSFRDSWDVKQLLRQVLLSRTFRQQSLASQKNWTRDPNNQWLSRGPRFRLDAEQVRDQVLFVSGLIKLQMGGKGVNPYQPPNIWEPLAFGGSSTRFYKQGHGDDLYRRTIYTFIKRTAPHPLMENFDMPAREQTCIRRDRTNTPLQALQLMNDVQHFEAARAFAGSILVAAETPGDRIDFAYRSLLARHAAPEEVAVLTAFLQRQLQKYQSAPAEAKKAITFGESAPPAGVDEVELAAWTLVANLIFNLDEAIVRN